MFIKSLLRNESCLQGLRELLATLLSIVFFPCCEQNAKTSCYRWLQPCPSPQLWGGAAATDPETQVPHICQ